MPGLSGIHLIGKPADRFHTAAVLFYFARETLFGFRGGAGLILDSNLEPGSIHAETVHPVAGGYQCFNKPFKTEVAEQFPDSGIATVNFTADRFARALARKVDASLFIEDRERWIDAQVEPMVTKKNSAEAMDCGNGRRRKNRKNF